MESIKKPIGLRLIDELVADKLSKTDKEFRIFQNFMYKCQNCEDSKATIMCDDCFAQNIIESELTYIEL